MRGRLARQPSWLPPVLYALALHAAVIALLVAGFRIVSRDEVPGEAIQATVVREPAPEAQPEPAPPPEPPKPDPELAKREAERKKREAEAEQQRQQQEVERQKQEQEKRKQEEEALRIEAEKKKQEEEKKKKAEAEKRKLDEERKKAEKQRQQQTEQALREQLEAEEKARAAARSARRAPEADKYKAAIRQRVERHWARPGSSRKDLQCTVRVRLIPGGEVLEATVVRSSGDATFDRSVENAVHKASPLPLPEDAELFEQFREIEFIFRPEE